MTFIMRMTNKTADETLHCIRSIMDRLNPKARQTMTFDNDMTFAKHDELVKKFKLQTWFCDAYASWQKGGIENTNGRIRRWLPRKTDLDAVSDQYIEYHEYNQRNAAKMPRLQNAISFLHGKPWNRYQTMI